MTIENLASMVKRGFDETTRNFVLTAKQKDLEEVKDQLWRVEERVENIEKLLLKQQNFRIQELEKRMKRVEDLFAVK